MIEKRSTSSSKVNLPVLEGTQRRINALKDLPSMARNLSLLGDPTRLKILLALANAKELCVCDLADILKMETSAVSHQLRKLRDGGLVENERDGTTIYYRLVFKNIRDLLAVSRSLLLEGQDAVT